MLFGDEKRFAKPLVPSNRDGQVLGVQLPATDRHVGPGSYYASDAEEKRGGWRKPSFSQREPMSPGTKDRDITSRSALYTHGVLTSYGAAAVPVGSSKVSSPGPGYYDRDIFKSPKSIAPKSPSSQSVASARSPGASRFAFDTSAVLRDGVLFVSRENNRKDIGPGHYSTPLDTLQRPSFNVRASSGKGSLALSPTGLASSGSFRSNPSTPSSRAKSAPRSRR